MVNGRESFHSFILLTKEIFSPVGIRSKVLEIGLDWIRIFVVSKFEIKKFCIKM